VFIKSDAERASDQAAKARHDAAAASTIAATGARNLGAAVLATLAEATAPKDDKSGKRHARRAKAKAVKAATKDREAASKAAAKAATHGRKAALHGRKAIDKRSAAAGGSVAALAGVAGAKASDSAHRAAEAARERSSHAAGALRERTAPLGEAAAEKAGMGAALLAALAAAAREKAEETRIRAAAGVDHGIDVAVPRAQESVALVGSSVDHLRDVINEELLPKLQAMLGDVQANRVLAKDDAVVATLTGETKAARNKKGGFLITLGLLAAAGAGLAWYLSQQQKSPAKDPWASTSDEDPWASRTPVGTDDAALESAADQLDGRAGTAVTPAYAAGGSTTSSGTSDMVADAQVTETIATGTGATAATAASTTSVPTGDSTGTSLPADGTPHMLEPEEIDELGSEAPLGADEQGPGESPEEDIERARREARADDDRTL
jgi:hypothetical protein